MQVVVQEKRKRAFRLFYGEVGASRGRHFTVNWTHPMNLRQPASRWPKSSQKHMQVADANDFIHWYQNEEVTYWGRVVRRVPQLGRNAIMLEVDWGPITDIWGASAAALVTKFQASDAGARWDMYTVVPAAECDCAAEAGGVDPNWQTILGAHNRRIGGAATALNPVRYIDHLHRMQQVRPPPAPTTTAVAGMRTRGARNRAREAAADAAAVAAKDKRDSIVKTLATAMALPPPTPPRHELAGWLRTWDEKRIGWSTADALLVKSVNYREANFGRLNKRIGAGAKVIDNRNGALLTRKDSSVSLDKWRSDMKQWDSDERDESKWLRDLIREGHIQGVERANLASYIGTRVHMAMQMYLNNGEGPRGRQQSEAALWDTEMNGGELTPYIPNFPPSDSVKRYFESTADLDTLVAAMAQQLREFLYTDTGLRAIASELPVVDLDQLWVGDGVARGVESRIDFLAITSSGKLVLGDYKCRLGDTTMKTIGDAKTIRQLATYAWLVYTNYGLVVDELWAVYVTRELEVTQFSVPFSHNSMDHESNETNAVSALHAYVELWARGPEQRVVVDSLFTTVNNTVPFVLTRASRMIEELRGLDPSATPDISEVVSQCDDMPAKTVLPVVGATVDYDGDDARLSISLKHHGKGIFTYDPTIAAFIGATLQLHQEPDVKMPTDANRLMFNTDVQQAALELAGRWPHSAKRLAAALELPFRQPSARAALAPAEDRRFGQVVSLFIRKLNRLVNTHMRAKLKASALADDEGKRRFRAFVGASHRGTWPVWEDESLFVEARQLANQALGEIQRMIA